jgi:beta-N-acetylhexosaminidase
MKLTILTIITVIVFLSISWWLHSFKNSSQVNSAKESGANNPSEVAISELFMIGHWTNSPVASTTELIQTYGFGGVIIMDAPANPLEIKSWVDEWNRASQIPLLIAIDQEGGPVSRLKGDEFIQTSQREIFDVNQAYEVGRARGQELAALGINMNFAPVLDTATEPDSFMFSRTFGNTAITADLAASMIAGMASKNIIAVPKHFPGHADTSDDSHTVLPVVEIDRNKLDSFTTPFRNLLADNPPKAIMTAHVLFPQIDNQPVTLSPFFLTKYLRDTLQYENVIITDDMSMDSIDQDQTSARATVMAFAAGADLVLFAAEPINAINALKAVDNALEADDSLRAKLALSVERVQKLRR